MRNRMKIVSLSLGAGMAAILIFACSNTASAQGYYGGYGGGYPGGSYRVNRVVVQVDRGYCGDAYRNYDRDYYGGYDRCYSRPVFYPSYSHHGHHGNHGYRPQGPPHRSHGHGHHQGHHQGYYSGPRPRR